MNFFDYQFLRQIFFCVQVLGYRFLRTGLKVAVSSSTTYMEKVVMLNAQEICYGYRTQSVPQPRVDMPCKAAMEV